MHGCPIIMGPDAPQEAHLVTLDAKQLDFIDVGDVVPTFLASTYAHGSRKASAVHNY